LAAARYEKESGKVYRVVQAYHGADVNSHIQPKKSAMLYKPEELQIVIDQATTIFWFRRDLRLDDNAGLFHALKESQNVLALFIFDSEILDPLEDRADKRVTFIYQAIQQLKTRLERLGSSLLAVYGNPEEIFKSIRPACVYTNHDYEPYALKRDETVRKILRANGADLRSYKDQVIFEKDEIVKDNGEPYTVFTPYSKKWKHNLSAFYIKSYPVEKYFHRLWQMAPLEIPSLEELGFAISDPPFTPSDIPEEILKNYAVHRDYPGMQGTTRLGIHFRFGTISIRKTIQVALKKSDVWLNELIWREFYQMILWHFPNAVTGSFKKEYDAIRWRNDEQEFNAWCRGMTGYPIVDAGMRELNATGFMHNRARMITASFLTKHLLIDWRWGEAYFAKKLMDYDLAANNGGWQWAAGTGCDAAPYFRIFNPKLQSEKFDRNGEYIRKWIPELHSPDYPKPIVDHSFARERALAAYREALR
jgi:deoxyribodipyrimidine photo-lyase